MCKPHGQWLNVTSAIVGREGAPRRTDVYNTQPPSIAAGSWLFITACKPTHTLITLCVYKILCSHLEKPHRPWRQIVSFRFSSSYVASLTTLPSGPHIHFLYPQTILQHSNNNNNNKKRISGQGSLLGRGFVPPNFFSETLHRGFHPSISTADSFVLSQFKKREHLNQDPSTRSASQ